MNVASRPASLSLLGEPTWVSRLRREPYRLMFPLGAGLAMVGALPWLLFSLGLISGYPRTFHSLVMVQGFIACFVGGFLMTFVPRRTGAPPPSWWELSAVASFPALLTVGVGLGHVAIAELAWLAWLIVLARFVVVRLLDAPMNPIPAPSLVWIPISLGVGVLGTLVTGGAAFAHEMWLHDLGQRMVLQGMVAGLVMGVGGILLPVLTRASAEGSRALSRTGHGVAALVFWASYPLELLDVRLAFGVRAVVAAVVLVRGARLWALPRQTGVHVILAWLGAWALPLGHLWVALFPDRRVSGLHLVFIGCFSVLAFAIGAHVTWAHGNRADLLKQTASRSLLLPFGVTMLVAVVLRSNLELAGPAYLKVLALASAAFLLAVSCWLAAVLPVALRGPRRRDA